ncbi:MAG: hypothetical protein LBG80_12325 [Bacteroidales bacterium]|jgi:hypothetical protein|nr:hypothetical protein [Bacteroidales bacterium]
MKNKIIGFVKKYHAPLIGLGILILVCLIGYMYNYYPVNKYGIYTVGTVTDVKRTGGRVGPSCFFYFYYKGKRYEGSNPTNLKKKDIGKRFYVQFLKDNPNRCGLEDNKPVPDCIKEVPPEGWAEIPHCSYRDEKVVRALTEFYTAYISECDNPDGSIERIDSLRNKYLTKTLLTRLEAKDLDYDPILQAQDCDQKTIRTLEIDAEQKNVYIVCYTSPHNSQKTRIKLLIVEWRGSYLIDDILNDTNIV